MINVYRQFGCPNQYPITHGILKSEAVALFKKFYAQENSNGLASTKIFNLSKLYVNAAPDSKRRRKDS